MKDVEKRADHHLPLRGIIAGHFVGDDGNRTVRGIIARHFVGDDGNRIVPQCPCICL